MASQGDHVDCARLLLYHKAQIDDVTVVSATAVLLHGLAGQGQDWRVLSLADIL